MNDTQLAACVLLACLLLIAFHFSGQSYGRADAAHPAQAHQAVPLVFAFLGAVISLILLLVYTLIP